MKGNQHILPVLLILLAILATAVGAQDEPVKETIPPPPSQMSSAESEAAQMPSLTESVLPSLSRIAISLCVIVGIIYLTVFLLRKLSGNRIGGKKGSTIQIIEQAYLAPKKSVCLLKLADRAVLVGITETNINLLTEMEWESLPPEVVERTSRHQGGFQGLLNEAAGKLFGGRGSKGAERENAL